MRIEPDLTAGRNPENPDAAILVTHATNQKLSEKKFWRNFGEFFEWRVDGPKWIPLIEVVFESKIKPKLVEVSDEFFSGRIDLENFDFGECLIEYVTARQRAFGGTNKQRLQKVLEFAKSDADFGRSIDRLASCLVKLFGAAVRNNSHAPLYNLLKRRKKLAADAGDREVRPMYIRQGLSKLLVLNAESRRLVYDAIVDGRAIPELPAELAELGFASEDLDGSGEVDEQSIRSVVTILGPDGCEQSLQRLSLGATKGYIQCIQLLPNFDVLFDYLLGNYSALENRKSLEGLLRRCFDSPHDLIASDQVQAPDNVWIYLLMNSLIKADMGSITAFGYKDIADGKDAEGVSKGYIRLADWLNRKKGVVIPDRTIELLAIALAKQAKRIGRKKAMSLRASTKAMFKQRCMYCVSTYRGFEPLRDIAEAHLSEAGVEFRRRTEVNALSEYVETGAITTPSIRLQSGGAIFWQSCHGSHVNDKAKELSGRFRAICAIWKDGKFATRNEVTPIIFIADGDWREQDFSFFRESGVERVYYPDEMGALEVFVTDY
jgi:hypothetical protein